MVLLVMAQQLAAQKIKSYIPDSLASKNYAYFEKQASVNSDASLRLLYAQVWLEKSKVENNMPQKAMAYKALMHASDRKNRLPYADSLLYAAKFTGDGTLIGSAYLSVGAAHYGDRQYAKALENYLQADAYIAGTADSYLKYKARFSIASIKYYLGYYHEAVSLFKECADFFIEENDMAYLKSLHGLGLSYNRLGNFDASTRCNRLGLEVGLELEENAMAPYFEHSEGMNHFGRGDFDGAVLCLERSLDHLAKKDDFANEAVARLFIGKSHWKLGRREAAVLQLSKMDSISKARNYYHPDLREAYELLIAHYQEEENREKILYFMEAQLKMFKVLNSDYRNLPGKIHKEYDTKKLVREMADFKALVEHDRIFYGVAISGLLAVVVIGYGKHRSNRKKYRAKYEELMNSAPAKSPLAPLEEKEGDLEIRPEVAEMILKGLEKFEARNKYAEQGLTAVKMAAMLNTNQKYLSKIILHYRGKNFIQYLSDLRIDYVVEMLKSRPIYRNYTNKALGEMAGFGSTQIFAQAFKARTGMPPTYFISELRKCNSNDIL